VPVQLYRVILPVGDIDAAATFYEALLGVAGRRVSPGRHYFDAGSVILALVDPRADGQGRDARPNQEHVYFSTSDLEGARARAVAARPSTGPGEIQRMAWGETSFYLIDPWGNPLAVVAAGTEFREGWVS
jgi:catechol 2,3-dioxygenase-like lactoylglutathione lyase family enzyme